MKTLLIIIFAGTQPMQIPMDNITACKASISQLHYVTRSHAVCIDTATGETVKGNKF